MTETETHKAIHARIDKMLKQKRFCYFTAKPDAQKQQLVIQAENNFWIIKNPADAMWVAKAKSYSEMFIWPLIGSPEGKYYEHYNKLYNEIKAL